jgi:hypothetical protein
MTLVRNKDRIKDSEIRMTGFRVRLSNIRKDRSKKKGQDKNPAPFLNPISYEKPNR